MRNLYGATRELIASFIYHCVFLLVRTGKHVTWPQWIASLECKTWGLRYDNSVINRLRCWSLVNKAYRQRVALRSEYLERWKEYERGTIQYLLNVERQPEPPSIHGQEWAEN